MDKKEEKKIILESDPDLITYRTNIEGWVDKNGRFWGKDKHMAIYNSITHKTCACGELMEKYWTMCAKCRDKKELENYMAYPYKEWDEKGLVYSYYAEKYFSDEGEIGDYCVDNEVKPEDLRLVLTVPNFPSELDLDQWEDIMPEDRDEFPKELVDAVAEFNAKIAKMSAISYSPCKTRTSVNINFEGYAVNS